MFPQNIGHFKTLWDNKIFNQVVFTSRKAQFLGKAFHTPAGHRLFNVITCDVVLFSTDTVAALDGTAQM